MSLVINTNISAIQAQRRLNYSTSQVEGAMERLASGSRINRAADDAAGLNISQNLTSQIKRQQQALRNTQDGVSIVQTAEGAISTIVDHLQRIRELTIQAANDTYSTAARDAVEAEMRSRFSDIDRISLSTEFNGIQLLDGNIQLPTTPSAYIQIGPNTSLQTNVMDLTPSLGSLSTGDVNNIPPVGVGLDIFGATKTFTDIASIDFASHTDATDFLSDIDNAITIATSRRAGLGSFQNQLESVTENLNSSIENLSASNSRIKDVDVAGETAVLTQYQVLQNAAVSVMAQSNRLPQLVLGLLEARG